jgi:hypothetical protein
MSTNPPVWTDEDGNYYGWGHPTPEEFRERCKALDLIMFGEADDDDGCGEMELDEVEHLWMRPDPEAAEDDDESYKWCEESDAGAIAVTRWVRP